MKLFRGLFAALALLVMATPFAVHAQATGGWVVGVCGTQNYAQGQWQKVTMDITGLICTNAATLGSLDSNGNYKVTQYDKYGNQADFTAAQPISRYGLSMTVLSSYAISTGGTVQTVAESSTSRQVVFIVNSDETNTGEDLTVNCLGNTPTAGSWSGGSVVLHPGDRYDPSVAPTGTCQLVAPTTGHKYGGYTG